ncbi:MAG TPA: hypothetical protein VGH19_02890 [Verrucomicrobiae bacterium]
MKALRFPRLKTLLISLGLLCLTAVVSLGALLYWITGPGYYAELNAVKAELERMPNVKILELNGVHDLTMEEIWTRIDIADKGEMGFFELDRDSFQQTQNLRLTSIGPYSFRTRQLVGDRESYGGDIEIGPSSPIPAVRSLGITSVQSAVAHYDKLLALVSTWPVTTNDWPSGWPPKKGEWSKKSDEEIHFADLPHGDYYFSLKQ